MPEADKHTLIKQELKRIFSLPLSDTEREEFAALYGIFLPPAIKNKGEALIFALWVILNGDGKAP